MSLTDPRGNLMYEYLRLIDEVRPRYFVLENVANITTAALRHRPIAERPGRQWSLKHYDNPSRNGRGDAPKLQSDEKSGSAIRKLLKDVRQLNYRIVFGVLDAADYGAPQHRLRFIMMGGAMGRRRPYRPPSTAYVTPGYLPFGRFAKPSHATSATPAQAPAIPRPLLATSPWCLQVGTGETCQQNSSNLRLAGRGQPAAAKLASTGGFRGTRLRQLSSVGANRKGSALCHPEALRPISVREAAALQGFPEDWQFAGSTNAQYLQVGNAVPIALGTALADSIHQAEPLSQEDCDVDFEAMLTDAVARLRASARNKRRKLSRFTPHHIHRSHSRRTRQPFLQGTVPSAPVCIGVGKRNTKQIARGTLELRREHVHWLQVR